MRFQILISLDSKGLPVSGFQCLPFNQLCRLKNGLDNLEGIREFVVVIYKSYLKCLNLLNIEQTNKIYEEIMHFSKFLTVSKMNENAQLISNQINKAQITQQDMHYRTEPHQRQPHPEPSSPVRLQPAENRLQGPESTVQKVFFNQRPNLLSPKTRKYQHQNQPEKHLFQPFSARQRKYSDNILIQQHEDAEKDEEGGEKLSTQENWGSPIKQSPQDPKNRKGSCNLEFLGFLKRPNRKNSDKSGPFTDQMQEVKLVKKKSLGWDENNNFKFSGVSNSSEKSQEEISSPNLLIPKLKSIRKQSDNVEAPVKNVPSFLTSSKHHRNSLNSISYTPEGKASINDFKIIKQLGKGAFGRVVLAVEKNIRLICAIKIMSKREIRQNNMLEQLVRELKIQLYVNHPNIVKVYGFFEDLLHCYILMECALDGHLSEYLQKNNNPLPETEAANYLSQICSAVSLLHSQHIIHRDLKPENVLLHEGIVKLCDFGWSVHRDANLRTTFCGTPVYLCPEILVGDEYDESVDIWTIGIILYFMFYKSNPFNITCREQLINILNTPIIFHEHVSISSAAKGFIQSCLAKRAIDRPNIRELLLHEFILSAQNSKQSKLS